MNPALRAVLLLATLAALPEPVMAQVGLPSVTATPGPGGAQTYALSLQALLS